jgi:hypothetical protein
VAKDPETEEQQERRIKANALFLVGVLNWRKWVEVADELEAAANVLGERVRVHWARWNKGVPLDQDASAVYEALVNHEDEKLFPGHNLLLAYVMENLLKALLVKKSPDELGKRLLRVFKNSIDPAIFTDGVMFLPHPLKSHNLVELASEAGLSLDEWETGTLRRFTRWSTWTARYHVPTKSKDMTGRKRDLRPDDPDNATRMIARIRAEIDEYPDKPSEQLVALWRAAEQLVVELERAAGQLK